MKFEIRVEVDVADEDDEGLLSRIMADLESEIDLHVEADGEEVQVLSVRVSEHE